jgi:hypothetical protein
VVTCPHEIQLLQAYRRAPVRVKALLQEIAHLHASAQPRRRMAVDAMETFQAA